MFRNYSTYMHCNSICTPFIYDLVMMQHDPTPTANKSHIADNSLSRRNRPKNVHQSEAWKPARVQQIPSFFSMADGLSFLFLSVGCSTKMKHPKSPCSSKRKVSFFFVGQFTKWNIKEATPERHRNVIGAIDIVDFQTQDSIHYAKGGYT